MPHIAQQTSEGTNACLLSLLLFVSAYLMNVGSDWVDLIQHIDAYYRF